jgi:hypothetical protein
MSGVGWEFIYAVDFVRQLSLSFQWWFLGLESLSFRWRFLVSSDTVFTNDSMRQQWLCFLCWFHASTVNLFSLSIPCVIHHQQQFTIPCVRHDSNVAIKSIRWQWLCFCYRFHARAVNYLTLSIPYVSYDLDFSDDFKVYSNSVFADDLWITSDIVFLTIRCVSHDSIFATN